MPNLSLRRVPTPLGPSAALERGDSFADRSPPGMARSNRSPRKTSLRWTPQQPSKAPTVLQIAAPHRDDQVGGKLARRNERGKRQGGRGEEEGRREERRKGAGRKVATAVLYSKREPNAGGLGQIPQSAHARVHVKSCQNHTKHIVFASILT